MNRLAAMQLWPPLPKRDFTAASAAALEVGVVEDDERVGAAELEHALLQRRAGGRADGLAGPLAAGQRDGGDPGVADDPRGRPRRASARRRAPAVREQARPARPASAKSRSIASAQPVTLGECLSTRRVAGRRARRTRSAAPARTGSSTASPRTRRRAARRTATTGPPRWRPRGRPASRAPRRRRCRSSRRTCRPRPSASASGLPISAVIRAAYSSRRSVSSLPTVRSRSVPLGERDAATRRRTPRARPPRAASTCGLAERVVRRERRAPVAGSTVVIVRTSAVRPPRGPGGARPGPAGRPRSTATTRLVMVPMPLDGHLDDVADLQRRRRQRAGATPALGERAGRAGAGGEDLAGLHPRRARGVGRPAARRTSPCGRSGRRRPGRR